MTEAQTATAIAEAGAKALGKASLNKRNPARKTRKDNKFARLTALVMNLWRRPKSYLPRTKNKIMWRLFYPLRYFLLVNDEKRRIDIVPTLLLADIITAPFIILHDASFFHKDGFLDKLLILTPALTGFYVAAFVAAATFSHSDLDKVFHAGPVALITRDANGQKVAEHLTRREFVCTIFGYLAFSSLLISLFASLFIDLSDFNHGAVSEWRYIGPFIGGEYLVYTRAVVIFVFAAAISHMAVVTSLGLYYLMDCLCRRDREIVTPKPK